MSKRLPIMFGIIGHVDHGKTSLVKALTNIETDRHPEEKRRGMSIDLGVASLKLPSGTLVGIIDLPGHSDFIRNMIAGFSAVNYVVLVVAANEGVMPQTQEHVEIASLLGLKEILLVITKKDLVSESEVTSRTNEALEFLAKYNLKVCSTISVSAQNNQGLDLLLNELDRAASSSEIEKRDAAFKMWVRDAFTMKGHGTVIRGVPNLGTVKVHDELQLHPTNKIYKVRAIQSYRENLESSEAGQSVALNLSDCDPEDFERGMVLTKPGSYKASKNYILAVTKFEKKIGERFKALVHCGTARMAGVLKDLRNQEKGNNLFQIKFEHECVLAPGEKVLIRNFQGTDNIGGGVIIGSLNKAVIRNVSTKEILNAALSISLPIIFKKDAAIKILGTDSFKAIGLANDFSISDTRLGEFQQKTSEIVNKFHKKNPNLIGMKVRDLAKRFATDTESILALLKLMPEDFEVILEGDVLKSKNFNRQLDSKVSQMRSKILQVIEQVGMSAIAKGDIESKIGVNDKELTPILKGLLDEGLIVSLGTNLISNSNLEHAKEILYKYFSEKETLELASFKENLGVSRNVTVMILEKFDGLGITKRVGNVRMLVRK